MVLTSHWVVNTKMWIELGPSGVTRVAHFTPDPHFPASPSPFGGDFLGENGEMGRDGDENHPQIEMGMGMGRPPPIPISPFSPLI